MSKAWEAAIIADPELRQKVIEMRKRDLQKANPGSPEGKYLVGL